MLIGSVGQPVPALAPGSLLVVLATSITGVAATIAQLRLADNSQ
jgi:hypothetical protein